MLRTGSPLSKAAGSMAILIVIVSAVFVIAHQCHVNQNASVAVHQVSHEHGAGHGLGVSDEGSVLGLTSAGFIGSSLFREIGASIFFLVLVLGGKFLLRVLSARSRMKSEALWVRSRLRLINRWSGTGCSLPKLGVCRI
jgi:hypothetical protein